MSHLSVSLMATSMSVILFASRDRASNEVPCRLMLHMPAPKRVTGSRSGFPPSYAFRITSFGVIASPFVSMSVEPSHREKVDRPLEYLKIDPSVGGMHVRID